MLRSMAWSRFPNPHPGNNMGKGRFLNQKLGKRISRKFDLLKSRLAAPRANKIQGVLDVRLPKKGASRQGKPGKPSE